MQFTLTGRNVKNINEYSLGGVRFLYKEGTGNRLLNFFSSLVLKGEKQSYNYFNMKFKDDDTLLFFLDSNTPEKDPRGTYFLGNEKQNYLDTIKNIILEVIDQKKIEDTYYFGSSKGATGAILTALEVGKGVVLINAPQVKIHDYITTYHPNAIDEINMSQTILNDLLIKKYISLNNHNLTFYITCGFEDDLHLNKHLLALFKVENTNNNTFFLPVRGGHTKEAIDDLQFLMDGVISSNLSVDKAYAQLLNIQQYSIKKEKLPSVLVKYIPKRPDDLESLTYLNQSISFFPEKTDFSFQSILKYNFRFIEHKSDKLIIMLNGAVDRNIAKFPVFQRSSWANEIDANILYIEDPTVNENNNLGIGWYLGSSSENAQYILCSFLKSFFHNRNFENKNISIFGSSCGGFGALMLATHLKVKAIVNNPQTIVLNYSKVFVKRLIEEMFENIPTEVFEKKYANRIDILNLLGQTKNTSMYYYQNLADKEHYNLHFKPFLDFCLDKHIEDDSLKVILYMHYKEGHSPLSRQETIKELNSLSNNKSR